MESEEQRNRTEAAPGVPGARAVLVERVETLSPSVKGFRLACADRRPLDYVPGQWIHLHVRVNGVPDKRPYSIASAPDPAQPNAFEIAVTRVDEGCVSPSLHTLEAGATLQIDGPYGYFTREGLEQERALLVGTGTGVGPLRAMLQAALARPEGPPLTLLFGCRTEADMLYGAEFEAMARKHAHFRFEPSLSRPSSNWHGRRGYVQTQLAELVEREQRPHVFICGLSDMVNDVRNTLKRTLGYDRSRIHSERYD